MYTLSITQTPPPDWDAEILKGQTESLHLYHSTHWANRLIELFGQKPFLSPS